MRTSLDARSGLPSVLAMGPGARGRRRAAPAGGRRSRSVCRMLPDGPRFGRTAMAKNKNRSGREPKKQKQNKPKAKAAPSPFASLHEKPVPHPHEEKK